MNLEYSVEMMVGTILFLAFIFWVILWFGILDDEQSSDEDLSVIERRKDERW